MGHGTWGIYWDHGIFGVSIEEIQLIHILMGFSIGICIFGNLLVFLKEKPSIVAFVTSDLQLLRSMLTYVDWY